MDLESVIQSEVSQKNKYCMLAHIYGILKKKKLLMNLVAGQDKEVDRESGLDDMGWEGEAGVK